MKKESNTQNKVKNFKQGFTLLELLIVVLIIGILAGIALPNYQRATAKAELTQVISVLKPYAEAQERYFLANGQYATSTANLDVRVPGHPGIGCYFGQNFWVYCYSNKFMYVTFLQGTNHSFKGQTWCGIMGTYNSDKYDNVCKDMFPQAEDITSRMFSYLGTRKGWRIR